MKDEKVKTVTGWIAFGLSLIIASAWAFRGAIENFHEGWYFDSFLINVGLMLIQYASPMLIFVLLTLLAIWKQGSRSMRLPLIKRPRYEIPIQWLSTGGHQRKLTQHKLTSLSMMARSGQN